MWYNDITCDVIGDVTRIRGFSRKTLAALTTTIESREWMRQRMAAKSHSPKHPRASSTIDVDIM